MAHDVRHTPTDLRAAERGRRGRPPREMQRHYTAVTVGCFGVRMTTRSIRRNIPLARGRRWPVPAQLDRLFQQFVDQRRSRRRLVRCCRCGDCISGIRRVAGQDRGRLHHGHRGRAEPGRRRPVHGHRGPGGNICDVKGPGSASFDYTVVKESPANTWSQQVATIKGDNGQALSEPGIGDRAVWGGEEFAAEADGYIVGVIGADFPSTPQGSGFVRTGKIAKLLISKL